MTEIGDGIREWALHRVLSKLPHEAAEDVVQETLIKMASKDIPEDSQKSWLITALPRLINREFKSYVTKRSRDISLDTTEFDEDLHMSDTLSYHEYGFGIAELGLFLEQVGEDELLLQYVQHEAKLADILGIKPSNLRMRVKKARDTILPIFMPN